MPARHPEATPRLRDRGSRSVLLGARLRGGIEVLGLFVELLAGSLERGGDHAARGSAGQAAAFEASLEIEQLRAAGREGRVETLQLFAAEGPQVAAGRDAVADDPPDCVMGFAERDSLADQHLREVCR